MSHAKPKPKAPSRKAAVKPGRKAAGKPRRKVGVKPSRKAEARPTRSVRFWVAPILISVAVLSALAALYLGGILNPTTNLRHLPIAIVNEDSGPTGKQVLNGMVGGLDKDKFDVRILTPQTAQQQLNTAGIYGAVGIAPTFSAKLQGVARAAVKPGPVSRPVISVLSNPRAGTMGSNIASQALNRAAAALNHKIAKRLMEEVAEQTQGGRLSSSAAALLSNPVAIESQVYKPLPEGTGSGLSAFYYALLLLLAGFTGSIVISTLVDSMLGYVPAEFGPVYRFAEKVKISRFRTLLIKWAVTVMVALLTSAAYLSIAKGLGMPFQNTWVLWLFGVFAIAAVGITSTSLIAVLGTVGLLVSMFIFRHSRLAVGRRHGSARGDAAVLQLAGKVRADAPSVSGHASTAVFQWPVRRRAITVGDIDSRRFGYRNCLRRDPYSHLRPPRLSPYSGRRRAGGHR